MTVVRQITNGKEHRLVVIMMRKVLNESPGQHAEDTAARTGWLDHNPDHFVGLFLVGVFAYLEAQLKKGWIPKYGGLQKRELYVLRVARNAYVHTARDLRALDIPKKPDASKGRPAKPWEYVADFCSDLRAGHIQHRGQQVPDYMTVTKHDHVRLDDRGFGRIGALSDIVLTRASRIQWRVTCAGCAHSGLLVKGCCANCGADKT